MSMSKSTLDKDCSTIISSLDFSVEEEFVLMSSSTPDKVVFSMTSSQVFSKKERFMIMFGSILDKGSSFLSRSFLSFLSLLSFFF